MFISCFCPVTFIIHATICHRCFKNVKNLPCCYLSQCKCWMTGEPFKEWLINLDRRMERHSNVDGIKTVELSKLPPNTTSKTQPMDQGVIRSMKAKYRLSVVFKMLRADIPGISMVDAMVMLNNTWNDITPETIVNCFRKAGMSPYSREQAVHHLHDPFRHCAERHQTLCQWRSMHPH